MKQEDRVKKAMDSLDGIQRAKAPEQTFAKIQKKLADQRKEKAARHQPSRFAWVKVAAVIAMVLCSNIWAVTNYLASESMTAEERGDYSQIVTDFNLYENE
ncbi:hypothetical protein OKW21_004580 [Catalinimonas alkaloidigena]|uniref:hypothetical protein n=1 Tax=Catalinimonas alkaloidigena TaxID=1075417 RepID=UPI002404B7C0|nr:hypothetical protein [Catalinimonas alkaloidigena]MDF9799317.1 hypothetical protein [Catalinimonas alkaloidigena]